MFVLNVLQTKISMKITMKCLLCFSEKQYTVEWHSNEAVSTVTLFETCSNPLHWTGNCKILITKICIWGSLL